MKKSLIVLLTTTILLSACTAPTEEEISDAVSKKVEEEVNKVADKATEEATKKVDELLETGTTKVGDFFNSILEEEPAGTSIDTGGTTARIPVKLIEQIDGDTIKVEYNGKIITIRYLLIDTPETVHPDKNVGVQPFGKEASARNKELLENGELSIEFDVGERVDPYNRLLAYLYIDDISIQETLLKEGLARVGFVYPPNTRYLSEFEAAEAQAKKEKIGIWSLDGYVTESGFKP